jgi:hypothetical protein
MEYSPKWTIIPNLLSLQVFIDSDSSKPKAASALPEVVFFLHALNAKHKKNNTIIFEIFIGQRGF